MRTPQAIRFPSASRRRSTCTLFLIVLGEIFQDLRYAFRTLQKSPGFAAVAILSLALGIGANTAIFSLIDAVILKSLPVRHPEELLQVMMGNEAYGGFSNPNLGASCATARTYSQGSSPMAAGASISRREARRIR